jgi:hypothetical protein
MRMYHRHTNSKDYFSVSCMKESQKVKAIFVCMKSDVCITQKYGRYKQYEPFPHLHLVSYHCLLSNDNKYV